MKLREILQGVSYQVLSGDVDVDVKDLAYDSRQVQEGFLFVALAGAVTDGHAYISQALKAGAKALVVEHEVDHKALGIREGFPVVMAQDGRTALSLMAANFYDHPASKMKMIGITGTKGKTTTAFMVRDIIEKAGFSCGLIGTVGTFFKGKKIPSEHTTPESYDLQKILADMVAEGCEYLVMEVSSQAYKLKRVAGIHYHVGVFTNITPDHIGPGEHEDFAEYLTCKKELLKNCDVALVNRDDEHWAEIIEGATCKIYSFGKSEEADLKIGKVAHQEEDGTLSMVFETEGRYEGKVVVGLPGRFNVKNATAALGVSQLLDLVEEPVLQALKDVKVAGRVEPVPGTRGYTVLIDYAHNGVSTESVLTTLMEYNPGRLVAIFGCGGNRSKLRRYEMGEVVGALADFAIVTADNPRKEAFQDIVKDIEVGLKKAEKGKGSCEYVVIEDRGEAVEYGVRHAKKGDIIVLLGKGHEDYQEIQGVRYPYSDKAAVLNALKKVNEGNEINEE